jgi:hypothetical protein
MPSVNIPDETYRKLSERAEKAQMSVEDLLTPALEKLATACETLPASDALSYEEWKKRFDELLAFANTLTDRLPPGHVVDCDRESIYKEREDAQL